MENNKVPNGWKLITYKDVEKVTDTHKEETVEKKQTLFSKMRLIFFPTKEEKLFVNPFYEFNQSYWKRNLFPVLIEIGLVIFCMLMPVKHFIYVKFAFFFLLYISFVITKSFSWEALITNFCDGLDFWKDVLITAMLYGAAIAITDSLASLLPNVNPVFIPNDIGSGLELFLYSVTMLYLAPISEEIFFREGLICNHSKPLIVLSSLLSMALFSIKYAFAPWGIFLVMIWALPLTWAYIKTGNVYICITAHFLVNFIGKIPTIIAHMIK